jgi:hypothetical protein
MIARWGGPEHDIVSVRPSARVPWFSGDPSWEEETLVFWRILDDDDEPTGEIVGVEIDEFLRFERWDLIPTTPDLWQLDEESPLPPVDLLRRLQARFLAESGVAAIS